MAISSPSRVPCEVKAYADAQDAKPLLVSLESIEPVPSVNLSAGPFANKYFTYALTEDGFVLYAPTHDTMKREDAS